jgi:hypothetical protein
MKYAIVKCKKCGKWRVRELQADGQAHSTCFSCNFTQQIRNAKGEFTCNFQLAETGKDAAKICANLNLGAADGPGTI